MTGEGDGSTDGFEGLAKGVVAHGPNYKHSLQENASDTFIAALNGETSVSAMKNELGNTLRQARRQLKKPMSEVAEAVGVSTAAVQQWETGGTMPSIDNLTRAAMFLGLDAFEMMAMLMQQPPPGGPPAQYAQHVAAAHGGTPISPSADTPPNAIIEDREPALPERGGARDIEELGIAVGGDGEDDGAFEFNGQVVDRVTRPPGIKHRKDVFALRIANSSMFPKFEDGERIFAERRRPAIGDYVVVELFPAEEGRAGKGFVKKLVSMHSGKVVVEQFNPPKTLEFERERVKDVHRVIPWQELLGV